MPPEQPKVLISYSHDSSEHEQRVLTLADRLRADGIDCMIDQYVLTPSEGWPRWMEQQIRESDFVLMVCTEDYSRRVLGGEDPGRGRGVRWEGQLIFEAIYQADTRNTKFIPVVLEVSASQWIPAVLQGTNYYDLGANDGYEELYRRLTDQPRIIKPKLGQRRSLPPAERKSEGASGREVVLSNVPHEITASIGDHAITSGRRPAIVATPLVREQALGVLERATKEQPWQNSLGMKFVPVAGTQVLFSVWNTRVQDFRAFMDDKPRYDPPGEMWSLGKDGEDGWMQRGATWKEPGFQQGSTHPTVGVSWNDAKAFCAWLTEREHRSGALPEGMQYRLPTDEEWSVAVGLPFEPEKMPEDKDSKINLYPWGKKWPPPARVGNYRGEESKIGNEPASWRMIKDYNDGYSRTSPVGSFAANKSGLYDMGGNVWQWCEDWYNSEKRERVLRGASWYEYDPRYLLASRRYRYMPDERGVNIGFRCVLLRPEQPITEAPNLQTYAPTMKDIFISYTKADQAWAEWIAWTLEEAGLSVIIQAWDFRPGGNFVLEMQRAASETGKTIVVLSPAYLQSEYTQPEWASAFAQDPQGKARKLIPVRIAKCKPTGMLASIIYVDLLGLPQNDARAVLLGGFNERAKPSSIPTFPGEQSSPGSSTDQPAYPGTTNATSTPIAAMLSSVVESADHNHRLSLSQRLLFIRKLNAILPQQFNMLLFSVNPEPGLIPPMPAPQGDRTAALLTWAEAPGGCGLSILKELLDTIVNPQ